MADPRKTVQLLNQLVAIGFINEAFQRLHHMGRRVTIAVHRAYCEKKISSFKKDSTNARVERRLEFVFQKYRAGAFESDRVEIFNQLADEAVAEIPFNGGKSVPFETTLGPRVTPPNVLDRSASFNLSDATRAIGPKDFQSRIVATFRAAASISRAEVFGIKDDKWPAFHL